MYFFFYFLFRAVFYKINCDFLFVCPTCPLPRVDVVTSMCCASSRGLRPAPLLNSMEEGTSGGAKAELRDIVAATDWARCEGSVVVIRQGNEADLFCNDVGGPLDIFSVAVSTNDPASTTPPTTQLVLPCEWVRDLYGRIKEQILKLIVFDLTLIQQKPSF